jgi:hypothetical protein
MIFGRAHPCFFSDRLVLEGATRISVLCCHQVTFYPWWSQRRRISWRPNWRTNKWRFESLHCWGTCFVFWFSQQYYARRGGNTGEVQSLTFQNKNPRYGLNWLCLAMSLLKASFWEQGLSSGWKPKIFDQATTALVHCFLLVGVAFGEPVVQVLSWW